ncbi:MAG: hypothetical protein CL920_25055 [Deltaproteobacteria bacterium]|nr:hypothetical protein [Deltaproteobacteria bacterium]MBU51974.1 hypothetical protein [Deltaproteobacteria bacterium]
MDGPFFTFGTFHNANANAYSFVWMEDRYEWINSLAHLYILNCPLTQKRNASREVLVGRLAGVKLEDDNGIPLYRQLVDQLSTRIRSGALPSGYKLPPTRELAKDLNIHRNTVVRAFEELSALGFVKSMVGRGTFVADVEEAPIRYTETLDVPQRSLPWDTLVSQATELETVQKIRRISQQVRHREWYNLARMEPPVSLFPVERFRHCIDHVLRTQKGKALRYAPREGLERLRTLLVDQLATKGIPVRVEDVMITTGSQQGLDLVARALLDPGDTILMQTATYTGALGVFSASGARSIGVPGDDDGPSIEFLHRLNTNRVKGFYLMPDVCNPTGVCISEKKREKIIEWSHERGIPLIEDDYASDMELDDELPPPALRALDPEVIYMGTFSKKLIPALRVGYLICPQAFHKRILPMKHAMDLGTSVLIQQALAEFLERGYMRAHLKQILPEYKKRRDALEASLTENLPEEITWNHPKRGPLLWLKLPQYISPEEAFEEARREGVLVNPSSLHEATNQRGPNGLRLVFLHEEPERLHEAGKRLGQALKRLCQRVPVSATNGERAFNGI